MKFLPDRKAGCFFRKTRLLILLREITDVNSEDKYELTARPKCKFFFNVEIYMRFEILITVTTRITTGAILLNVLSNSTKESVFSQNVSRRDKEYSYVRYVAYNTENSVLCRIQIVLQRSPNIKTV
jgi:hypothetical protein